MLNDGIVMISEVLCSIFQLIFVENMGIFHPP
jgi:hypothetical protein